jgi:hypothetical protein
MSWWPNNPATDQINSKGNTEMKTFVTAVAFVLGAPSALLVLVAIGDGKAGLVSGGLFYIALCLATYFLPTIIAMLRRYPAWVGILLLNLFLGWTLIGWVAALVWSVMPIKPERRLTEQALIERRIADELRI